MMLLTALTPSPRYNRATPANNGFGFCGSGPGAEGKTEISVFCVSSGRGSGRTGWREGGDMNMEWGWSA